MAVEAVVYRLDLLSLESDVPALCDILSEDERARADRFRFPQDASRYVASHAILRLLLGRRLNHAATALRFECGPQGKPFLPGGHGWAFNLSHSGDWALIAVAQGCEVGVDIERVRPQPDALRLAERFFSKSEAEVLRSVAPDERQTAFLWCWTRKEAYLKGLGTGIAHGLAESPFPVVCGPSPTDFRLPPWSVRDLQSPEGYVGAVAVRSPQWTMRVQLLAKAEDAYSPGI